MGVTAQKKLNRRSRKISNITELGDLIGLRLILLFHRDVETACNLIPGTFDIIESEDTGTRLNETQFGYQSRHFVARIPETWWTIPTFRGMSDLRFEIQVRTVAQHIWAAASHKLQYKQEDSVPPPVRRSIHRVSALLETVDLEFERVLQERESYVSKSAEHTAEEPLNTDIVAQILDETFPPTNKSHDENYAELVNDLTTFGVHTTGKLRLLLNRHKHAALESDKQTFAKNLTENDFRDMTSERIRNGVFFSHVGLAREAMLCEFGTTFRQYMQHYPEDDDPEDDDPEYDE